MFEAVVESVCNRFPTSSAQTDWLFSGGVEDKSIPREGGEIEGE
jgi:hypothetical protein